MATPDSTKAPAFQFYVKDFLGDADQAGMSLLETGAYIRLMCFEWNANGKGIPDNLERIARMIGSTPAQVRKLWPAVRACFVPHPTDASRLIHPRLQKERDKQSHYRRRQSDAAAKRWHPPSDATAYATALPPHMPQPSRPNALQSSSASSDLRQKDSTSAKVAHKGDRLMVWHWQHEDLARRLGSKIDAFDLTGWYSRLEAELARTGESFADPWKWLQERLYRDAKLSLPNLMGKRVEPERRRVPTPEETKAMLARSRADG